MKLYFIDQGNVSSIYYVLSYILKIQISIECISNLKEASSDGYFLYSFFSYKDFAKFDSLIKEKRKDNIDIKIIVGGSGLYYLDDIKDFQKRYPEVDYVVIGKGEEALTAILTKDIPKGILYDFAFAEIDNYVIHPFFFPYIKEIKMTFLDEKCFWNKCSYCHHTEKDSIHYNNSSIDLFNEIVYYYKHGLRTFCFYDNFFVFSKFYDLLDKLLSVGINDVSFRLLGLHVKTNYKKLKEYVPKFKKLIIEANWGVEFLDDEILEKHQKGVTVNNIKTTVDYCYDNNIIFTPYFLYGLPLVKEKNILNHIDNLNEIHPKLTGNIDNFFMLNEKLDVYKRKDFFKVKKTGNFYLNDFEEWLPDFKSKMIKFTMYDFEEKKYCTRLETFNKYKSYEDINIKVQDLFL